MSSLGVAALVSVVVGLPGGAVAPAPGALPPGARVKLLDRALGLVEVGLPRAGLSRSLARLRHAPGTSSVSLASAADDTCVTQLAPDVGEPSGTPLGWIRLPPLAARRKVTEFTIGVADTGVDFGRLGTRTEFDQDNFAGGSADGDALGHGTAVAGLIAGNRDGVGVLGVVPEAGVLSARIGGPGACSGARLQSALVHAFGWFRERDVNIVNVSASVPRTAALERSLRSLQEHGVLVVAAAGNAMQGNTRQGFPAAEPHVLGVTALASRTQVWRGAVTGPLVDVAAPAAGLRSLVPTALDATGEVGLTPEGTSFAAPLVTGAAALVWSRHGLWDADRVAAALRTSAVPLSGKTPLPSPAWGYGRLDVTAALTKSVPDDPFEPNDWGHAASDPVLPILAGRGPRSTTLSASLDPSNDPVDGYAVALRRGQRVTATLSGAPAGTRLCTTAATSSYALLRCRSGGGLKTRRVAAGPGRLLVVVAGDRAGRYHIRLTRS